MARMIGKANSGLAWLMGLLCALVFGSEAIAADSGPCLTAEEARRMQLAATLEASAEWKTVVDAWQLVMPFARSGQSTTAQRKECDEKVKAHGKAVKLLVAAGLLSEQEAELLNSELDKAIKDILRNPPTDCLFTCYDSKYVAPARMSLESIAARLPAVEKLVEGGKVRPAAAKKVLEAVEADFAALSGDKQLAGLNPQQREAAEKAREILKMAIKARLESIKGLLDKQPAPAK